MNLKLESGLGTFEFTLEPENVKKIIESTLEVVLNEKVYNSEKAEAKEDADKKNEFYKSVGAVAKEICNSMGKTSEKEPEEEKTEDAPGKEGYRGFLHIKCEKCGYIHTFCSKENIKTSSCVCGHHTAPKDLKKLFVKCQCGASYRYFTNLTDEEFEISCYTCGSPVDVHYNERHNIYEAVGSQKHFGRIKKRY